MVLPVFRIKKLLMLLNMNNMNFHCSRGEFGSDFPAI